MTRHAMNQADAAWLRMDKPTNLMVINSIMWFDDPLDLDDVRKLVQERLVDPFPRFRQRVVHDHGHWWEDDPGFELDRHIRVFTLPEPGGQEELEELVAGRSLLPLDPTRPLWELNLVQGYGGGSALYSRIHHCIADGISLVRVLLSLADDPDTELNVGPAREHVNHGLLGSLGGLVALAGHEVIDLALHPTHVAGVVSTGVDDAAAAAKLLALPPDHHTPLRGRTTADKQVTWSRPISLELVKTAAHASHATINDFVLAAVAGALRTELQRRGTDPVDIRAIVPYNLRPLDEPVPADLGNRFGLVYLSLPVGVEDRKKRLAAMSRRMGAIKHSAEGIVSYGILDLVGRAPSYVEDLAIQVFASKATAVMTNVPGPRHSVSLAGRTLRGTIGWPPMSGDIGVSVSIFSYDGEIVVGLMVDRSMVPDAHVVLEDVYAEIDRLSA